MNNELTELATGLQHGLFATRDTIEEAFKYAYEVIEAMPSGAQTGAYAALHIVVNTIAEEVKRMAKENEDET